MSQRRSARVGGGQVSGPAPTASARLRTRPASSSSNQRSARNMLVTGTTLGEPSVSARPQTVGGGSKPRSRPASQQSSSRPRTGLGAPTAKDTLAARPATTIGSSRADFSARGGKDKSNIFTPAKLSAPPSPVGVAPGPGYDSSESIMDLMHDDPEEFLLRLQHQRSRDHRRGAALKGNEHAPRMNAYSRPVHSKNQPLRSSFLDPETNNFPRSKTKKELQRKKKLVNMPHMSYDIDGDGYVSQEDYFMAKRFDMDGNGVLDADEQEVGRFIMAQEFFKRHENDVSLFGPEWSTVDMKKNIHTLATSATFQKAITKLNESEKHFRDIGSQEVDGCLTMKKDVIKHNWYNDKFDTTAWCDFGANPRKYDPFTTDNSAHEHGSRHKMYALRKINARDKCQALLDRAEAGKPRFSNARMSLITNVAIENS